jgi:hypothetical protein
MARPAPNTPHGGDYDDDGEAGDDRPIALPGKRGPSKSAEQRASQPPARSQSEARRPSEPDDIPWQDLDEPVAAEDTIAAGPEQGVAVPLPEPTYPPPLKEDPDWEADEASDEPKTEATTAKPPKAGKRRASHVASIIYLILLAIMTASLSAAVVLYLL